MLCQRCQPVIQGHSAGGQGRAGGQVSRQAGRLNSKGGLTHPWQEAPKHSPSMGLECSSLIHLLQLHRWNKGETSPASMLSSPGTPPLPLLLLGLCGELPHAAPALCKHCRHLIQHALHAATGHVEGTRRAGKPSAEATAWDK